MKISELITSLRETLAEHGDLDVVSGLDRSGYGEEIIDANVLNGKTMNEEAGDMTGPTIKVVDLKCSDESMVEMAKKW